MNKIANKLWEAFNYKQVAFVNYNGKNMTIAILALGTDLSDKRKKVALVHIFDGNESACGYSIIKNNNSRLQILEQNGFAAAISDSDCRFTHNYSPGDMQKSIRLNTTDHYS